MSSWQCSWTARCYCTGNNIQTILTNTWNCMCDCLYIHTSYIDVNFMSHRPRSLDHNFQHLQDSIQLQVGVFVLVILSVIVATSCLLYLLFLHCMCLIDSLFNFFFFINYDLIKLQNWVLEDSAPFLRLDLVHISVLLFVTVSFFYYARSYHRIWPTIAGRAL